MQGKNVQQSPRSKFTYNAKLIGALIIGGFILVMVGLINQTWILTSLGIASFIGACAHIAARSREADETRETHLWKEHHER